MSPAVELSVVLPMHNEEAVVDRVLAEVTASLAATGRSFEVVCVDDGSRDATLRLLRDWQARDGRVVALPLSRNFGKEAALAAGLAAARGRAVIVMDADLQHPVEVIAKMIALWDEGAEVVSGVKIERQRESFVYRAFAKLFNALMAGAAGASFQGASDFKLLDREVVDTLVALPERNRFFRGLVSWVGYRTAEVPFSVAERVAGTSKWSPIGLVRYSLRNLVAFSALPLRLVAGLGFVTLLFAAGLAVQTLYRYVRGDALSGFTTVILLQLILGGLLLTSVGVIAVYLSAIYEELKGRPLFIVRKRDTATQQADSQSGAAGRG
ncbi:MAG: glycosyltransferase family 2 protein [Myxococcales bacterium]